jgi:methionyl aminopeptidase
MVTIKTPVEIERMRKSCQLAASTLDYLAPRIVPGVSTEELDRLAHQFIVSHGAYPSPLNYHGFPKSICTSPNEVICHGIPSPSVVLQDGDILNVDVTTYLDKFHGDTNRTFFVGEVKPEVRRLVETTHECMMRGIRTVKPGARLGDIGWAIQSHAEANGYTVVRDYCGHGIGYEFHEDPQVLHYGKPGTGLELREGMTFTVEPMINMGAAASKVLGDGWTVITRDHSLSAQFEHTLAVTREGVEIMTLSGSEQSDAVSEISHETDSRG